MLLALTDNCGTPGHVWGNRRYWWESLEPYVKNWQVYTCPSDPSPWYSGGGGAITPYYVTSYGLNMNPRLGEVLTGSSSLSVFGLCGASLAVIESPAQKILLCDSEVCGASGIVAIPNWTGDALGFGNDVAIAGATRHNGGVNVGYCDGHAKWQQCASLGPTWPGFVTDLWKWQVNAP